jgi:DNA-binding transcriptional LysR family regulator
MGVDDFTPSGTLSFDQYDQVIQAAIHGQGVALGRMTIASQPIREKKLVVLFGRQQQIARGFHAVCAKGARQRPEVREFVEWLRLEIGRESA